MQFKKQLERMSVPAMAVPGTDLFQRRYKLLREYWLGRVKKIAADTWEKHLLPNHPFMAISFHLNQDLTIKNK